MLSNEIRQSYLDFFKSKGHTTIPSFSLFPENDSTLLFANSGMSPLVPYLLGEKHPGGKRLADSQKSFRSEDIDVVGDNRHTTFFEMLGNWSLGDYFKDEQLSWWFEFLIEKLKLDPKRIYQSVYVGNDFIEKDIKSIAILKDIFSKLGIEANEGPETKSDGDAGPGVEIDFDKFRIFAYRDKNWWQRGDTVGELGGPDSETFYDTGREHNPEYGKHCHVNCDCGRFLEIGNSVFMQYQKTEDGWSELANKNVDFGGGLARISMILQGKDNIFETDLYINIVRKIEMLSKKKYRDNMEQFEIIADHLKAATFIMGDHRGVEPSNVDQGYIVRRLIRRAIRHGKLIGINEEAWTHGIAEIVIKDYTMYPELKENEDFILRNLQAEEKKFSRTLEKGLIEFEKMSKGEKISGKQAFVLFSTYGFPFEMTVELAKEQGTDVNKQEFDKEFEAHQELSRKGAEQKFKGGLADQGEVSVKLHTTTHLMQAALRLVLGKHVEQKGSNITPKRLRFDFTHDGKMTDEQKIKVEDLVNDWIKQDLQVVCEEMSYSDAKNKNVIGLFEDKYGSNVKVYTIGDVSTEICGGPHVEKLGALGHFRIKKETSSSAGVRRIKAVLE